MASTARYDMYNHYHFKVLSGEKKGTKKNIVVSSEP